MLDALQIQGFKCFDDVEIPLKSINVFSGTNSSGKSTAIQAFLLLCSNAAQNSSSPLNGMWLRLGTFDECRNHLTNARTFQVAAANGNDVFEGQFCSVDDERYDVAVKFTEESVSIQNLLRLDNQHVFYLPANRIGPEDAYLKNFDSVNFLGNRAEFVIDFLYKNRKKAVSSSLIKDSASVTLEYQVNYWLERLFGINNTIKDLGLSNSLLVELSLGSGKPVRPYHIGSGISYAIGVIVSCLSASRDDVVIIENPEIHLHPKAQSDLTEFLCFSANSGIQVILETHSDHVFNGIRKAIVKKEITNTDVSMQFFQLEETFLSKNITITLNEQGRALSSPKGLFDQFDDDLDQIIGL